MMGWVYDCTAWCLWHAYEQNAADDLLLVAQICPHVKQDFFLLDPWVVSARASDHNCFMSRSLSPRMSSTLLLAYLLTEGILGQLIIPQFLQRVRIACNAERCTS